MALKQIEDMSERELLEHAARNGVFDVVALLPLGDRRYESPEKPGRIAAIRSADQAGRYHPLDKDALPIFDVLLDPNGNVVKK